MPVYEYRCQQCQRRFSVWWRSFAAAGEGQPVCTHCGSTEATRLISRIRVLRSEDQSMEAMADPAQWGDIDENDPKSLGRLMRKMKQEIGSEGEDAGPEFDEVIDRLESGQDISDIEKAMPDLNPAPAAGNDADDSF